MTVSMTPRMRLIILALASIAAAFASSAANAQIRFQNTTPSALDGFRSETWGAAFGDWNGDYWPDLIIANHRERPSLYRNNGDGTFTDVILPADTSAAWLSDRDADHHGMAFGDYDNDGDDDLFTITNGCCRSQFMTSQGERFVEEHQMRGFPKLDGNSNQWLDYNNDGLLDVIANGQVWQQNTGGGFSSAGTIPGCGSIFWLHLTDITGDGVQDIICSKEGTFPKSAVDISSGSPVNITSTFPSVGNVVDSAVADFDNDLDPDFLFVRGTTIANQAYQISGTRIEAILDTATNQVASQPNNEDAGFMFEGGGTVTFSLNKSRNFAGVNVFVGASGPVYPFDQELVLSLDPNDSANHGIRTPNGSRQIVIGYDQANDRWQFIMGGASADWWLVFAQVEGTTPLTSLTTQGLRDVDFPIRPTYLRSEPGGYVNRTMLTGLAQDTYQCNSVVAEDFDNDMDIDLFFACTIGARNISNRVFTNDGTGYFTEVTSHGAEGVTGAPVFDGAGSSEIAVTADYDNDGFVDVVVTNGVNTQPLRYGGPHQIFRNQGNANHWIALELRGTASNPNGYGATIRATAGGLTQQREYNGGYHRWSQNYRRAHFGLAGNTSVDLEISWPSGTVETYSNVPADSLYVITEGSGLTAVTPGAVADFPGPRAGDECGAPTYTVDLDKGVFIYRDCATDQWRVRTTGGFDPSVNSFSGGITSNGSVTGIAGFSLEGNDSLTSVATGIGFTLNVSSNQVDGFNFFQSGATSSCFRLNSPADARVYLGEKHIPMPLEFDLNTLQACSTGSNPTLKVHPLTTGEAVGTASVEVSLSPASANPVSAGFSTVSGSATGGQDFYGTFQTLDFAPGETSQTVDIRILDDARAEPTESFTARLFNPVGATVGTDTAPVTIVDNDSGPSVLNIFPLSINEGAGTAAIQVTLTPASASTVSVNFATTAGSATGGQDFYGKFEVLSFNPGQTTRTVNITLLEDSIDEANEQFTGRIFAANGASINTATATVTIIDNDNAPSVLDVLPLTVVENTGTAQIEITLTPAASNPVTVNFSTVEGTAIGGQDFYGKFEVVSFAAGETSKFVDVSILNDTTPESVEAFTARLFSPSGASIGTAQSTVTINDNDTGPPELNILPASVNENDGTVQLTLSLSAAATSPVTVGFATRDDTATSGQDFYGTFQTITFAPGDTSASVNITILNDNAAEPTERFNARIFNPVGATLGTTVASVTIIDDD